MTYVNEYNSLIEHNNRRNNRHQRSSVRAASIASTGSRPNSRPTSGNESSHFTDSHRALGHESHSYNSVYLNSSGNGSIRGDNRLSGQNHGQNRPGSRHETGNASSNSAISSRKNKSSKRDTNKDKSLSFDQNNCIFSSKEAKATYAVLVLILHFILLSIPFITTAVAWTLTNVVHAVTI